MTEEQAEIVIAKLEQEARFAETSRLSCLDLMEGSHQRSYWLQMAAQRRVEAEAYRAGAALIREMLETNDG